MGRIKMRGQFVMTSILTLFAEKIQQYLFFLSYIYEFIKSPVGFSKKQMPIQQHNALRSPKRCNRMKSHCCLPKRKKKQMFFEKILVEEYFWLSLIDLTKKLNFAVKSWFQPLYEVIEQRLNIIYLSFMNSTIYFIFLGPLL